MAFLSAVDDKLASVSRVDHPVFNILRVQRDLGPASRIGFTYTDKIDGANSNRVVDLDVTHRVPRGSGAFVAGRGKPHPYRRDRRTSDAPLWNATLRRTGRSYSSRYAVTGISDRFVAGSGFISRPGVAHVSQEQQFTWYGRPGALVESFTFDQTDDLTWQYRKLFDHGDAIEKKWHFSTGAALRGGWQVGASVYWESFGFDSSLFAKYYYVQPTSGGTDTVKFTGVPRIPNRDYVLNFSTPTWNTFSASVLTILARTRISSSGRRPTSGIRAGRRVAADAEAPRRRHLSGAVDAQLLGRAPGKRPALIPGDIRPAPTRNSQ